MAGYTTEELQALLDAFKKTQEVADDSLDTASLVSKAEQAAKAPISNIASQGNNLQNLMNVKNSLTPAVKSAAPIAETASDWGALGRAGEKVKALGKGAVEGTKAVGEGVAEAAGKVAPAVEAGTEWAVGKKGLSALAKTAEFASPALRALGKVAGPASIAYEALKSEDAGANSDTPDYSKYANFDAPTNFPFSPSFGNNLDQTSFPNSPSFGHPPGASSLFSNVSNQYNDQQKVGKVGLSENIPEVIPSAARSLASNSKQNIKSSLKNSIPATSTSSAPEQTPIEAPTEGYQLGTLENLEAAQKQANVLRMLSGLQDAGKTILDSGQEGLNLFTSKPLNVDYKGGEGLRAQAAQSEKDFQAKIENQKNDPKSQMSVQARAAAKAYGFDFGPNVSAADLEKQLPNYSNIFTQKAAQAARKEQYEFTAAENAKQRQLQRESNEKIASMRREDKKDAKTNDYLVKAAERINRFEQTDDVKTLRSTQNAASMVDAALAEPDENKRRGLLGPAMMMFGKIAQGDTSVLREGDQKVLTSNYGLNGDLIDKVAAALRGEKGLSNNDLANMKRVIQGVADLKKSYISGQVEKEKALGQKIYPGMTYEGLFNPDTMSAIGYDASGNLVKKQQDRAPGGSKPKTVTQNGHTYTLNEQTGEYE